MKNCAKMIKGKVATTLFAAVLGGFAANASASTIDLWTAYTGNYAQASATDYKNAVNSDIATTPYGSASLAAYDNVTNHDLFGSYYDIAFKTKVTFGTTAAQAGLWEFRFGVDFGSGGAVFLDGVAQAYNSSDMWWAGSYSNPTQYFDFTSSLAAGNHVLEVYGLEHCCDGPQQGQFKIGDAGFKTFSIRDGLDPVSVPEPSSLALLGAGILGIAATRKRMK